jgi:hypothetical protein
LLVEIETTLQQQHQPAFCVISHSSFGVEVSGSIAALIGASLRLEDTSSFFLIRRGVPNASSEELLRLGLRIAPSFLLAFSYALATLMEIEPKTAAIVKTNIALRKTPDLANSERLSRQGTATC